MRKYKCNDYHACGSRIKSEAHSRNLSNEDMRKILQFTNIKNVSYVYAGTSISDDVIEILHKIWGLRIDYLLCNDDFPTNEDKNNYYISAEQSQYNNAIKYLETLGYTFEINLYWICTPTALHKRYKEFSIYVACEDKEYFDFCIKEKKSYSEKYIFKLKDYPIKEYGHYKNYFYDIEDFMDDSNILFDKTKNNSSALFKNGIMLYNSDGSEYLQVLYDVKQGNKHIDYVTLDYAKVFFSNFDCVCKQTVKSMLSFNSVSKYQDLVDDKSRLPIFETLKNAIEISDNILPFQ